MATRRYSLLVAGRPSCKGSSSATGHIGTFMQLETCAPFFVRSNTYLPSRYAVVAGSLPPGMSLWGQNASAAQLDGTPTAPGRYAFTIAATDSFGGRASARFTVRVYPRLELAAPAAPGYSGVATFGVPFSATFTVSGGRPPYTHSRPRSGLTIDPRTGILSGTLYGHVCPFTLTVTDAAGATAWTSYSIAVYDQSGRPGPTPYCPTAKPPKFPPHMDGFAPHRGFVPRHVGRTPAFVTIAPVTITGRHFDQVEKVTFGGVRAVFRVDSPEHITAIPSLGAKTGPLVVTGSPIPGLDVIGRAAGDGGRTSTS